MSMQGGMGVPLKIDVTATLTTIVNLLDVDDLEFEKFLAEMTGHDAAGGYAEHVDTGKRKINPLVATIGWDDSEATHTAVIAAFNSTSPVDMSIEDPGGTEIIAFSAHLQKMARVYKQEDGYKAKVTIQPTGAPTIT
jgi:hypothetical protein